MPPQTIYTTEDLTHATENAQAVLGHLITVMHSVTEPPEMPPKLMDEYKDAIRQADWLVSTMLEILEDGAEE